MTDIATSMLSEESWESARGYAGVFGDIPSSFSVVVRSLMNDHTTGGDTVGAASRYAVGRLLKSPTLFAPLYFAAELARGAQQGELSGMTDSDIIKSFKPGDLAYLIGLVYFFRRAQSACEPEEFRYLADALSENATTGILLGRAIPPIGIGTALMEATAPLLGLACIVKHDAEGFKEYRRWIKREGCGWNSEYEMSHWGCSRIQIGSIIVQLLGFGISRANALLAGLTGSLAAAATGEEDPVSRDVRMANTWRTSMQLTGKSPTVALPAKYYPTAEALGRFEGKMSELRFDPTTVGWLLLTKSDLPSDEEESDGAELEEQRDVSEP